MSTPPSRSENRQSERGVAIILVVMLMALFLTLGGAAVVMSRMVNGYGKNREWAAQAFAAADSGLQAAVHQMLGGTTPSTEMIMDSLVDKNDPDYKVWYSAIIEPVSDKPTEFRVYGRGRTGDGLTVTKFVRAYVKFDRASRSSTDPLRKVVKLDGTTPGGWLAWEEIPFSVIQERAENSPKKDDFVKWVNDWVATH